MRTRTPVLVVLFICWAALLSDGYDLYVYGATLPGFLADPEWGVTKSTGAAVASLSLVGMLLGSLAAGILTDRLGRRRLLLVSLGLFSVGMVLCAMAPTFAVFAAFRILTCLGVGGVLPTAVAIAAEFAPAGRTSLAVGAVLTGPPIGSLLGALSAFGLVGHAGVRAVYALGGLSFLVFALAWALLPESPGFRRAAARPVPGPGTEAGGSGPAPAPRALGLAQLMGPGTRRGTLLIWAACFASMLTMFGLTTWLPVIMQSAGFSMGSSIGFLAVYSLGSIVGTVAASFTAQRTSPKRMVVCGFTAAVIALLIVLATASHGLLLFAIFLAGCGGMATQNVLNDHIAQYYPDGVRATGLGWALAVGRLGAIAGPAYGAFAAGLGGPPAAALCFAIPAFLGLLVAVLLPRRARRSAAQPASAAPEEVTA